MNSLIINFGGDSYKKIKYPAGEIQVRLSETAAAELRAAEDITVVARITSSEELIELLLLWNAIDSVAKPAARRLLALPYLPYARADRRFVDGDCFGLGTFASLMSLINIPIRTLDVHSDRARLEIRGLTNISALPLISKAIVSFADKNNSKRLTVLFPDEGARKRYEFADPVEDIVLKILHCSKQRDTSSGKLIGFNVPPANEFVGPDGKIDPVLIVDDICDGGGTFIGVAEGLKGYGATLGLYVTHGIFSKGLTPLESHFQTIYTTDSFSNRTSTERLQVLPSIEVLLDRRRMPRKSAEWRKNQVLY